MAEHEIPDFEIPKRERRAWVRLPSDGDASCRLAGAEYGWLGRVRDISQGGIALILRRQMQPETDLIIDLATRDGEVRSLPARVVRVTLERNGCWITGCEFASTLSQEKLQSFIGK
jgi:hypothetical protein